MTSTSTEDDDTMPTPTPHQIKAFLADRLETGASNARVEQDLLEYLASGETLGCVAAPTEPLKLLASVIVGEMRRTSKRPPAAMKKRPVINIPRRADFVPTKREKHWLEADEGGRMPARDPEEE